MFFADRLLLDKPRRSAEGFMGVHAKAARTGIYKYLGREIDPEAKHFAADEVVNVYRSPDEVFSPASLGSFIGKPITDDHPEKPVTANNWRDLARGTIMGAVKEGDYVGFDLAFLDAAAIDAVDGGKRELSNGYESELIFEDGMAPDGTPYRVRQVNIRGNHIALVDKGRAGSTCRIGDAAACDPIPSDEVRALLIDERTYTDSGVNDKNASNQRRDDRRENFKMPHTLVIDGLQVPNVSDEAKAAIEKLQGQVSALTADKAALETKVGEHVATIATKDGEITGLNAKLKDAEVSPAKLQQLVADRNRVEARAKAIDPSVVTDGKTDAEIRAAVVQAKLGDAAPTDENGIAGAFAALTADAKADPVATAISNGVRSQVSDSGASVRNLARAAQF